MRIPKLLTHKRTGWAFVKDPRTGRQVMMGHAGTVEAQENYTRWLAEFIKAKAEPAVPATPGRPQTVSMLLALWLEDCRSKYRRRDGTLTGTYHSCLQAAKVFDHLQDLPVHRVRKGDLIPVRDALHARGLAAKTINEYLGAFVRAFRFGFHRDWVTGEQLNDLKMWERIPSQKAKASKRVEAIPPLHLFLLWRHLRPRWRQVYLWHLFTGQRVQTALAVEAGQIDQSRKPWRYSPGQHKGSWRGHELTILVGPRARDALAPVLKRKAEGLLFRGRRVIRDGRAYLGPPTASGYKNALRWAVDRANAQAADRWKKLKRKPSAKKALPVLPYYSPRQVRHSAATWLRSHGVDEGIIGAILGHGGGSTLRTGSQTITGRYAQIHRRIVEDVVERFG